MRVLDQIRRKEREEQRNQRRKSIRAKLEEEEKIRAADPITQLGFDSESLTDALLSLQGPPELDLKKRRGLPNFY